MLPLLPPLPLAALGQLRPHNAAVVLIQAMIHGNSVPGYVTTICAVTWLGGVQLIVLGVIGWLLGIVLRPLTRRKR